jgi:hypothetical protein
MTHRRSSHLSTSLLVLGLSVALGATAHAQERQYTTGSGISATLRVNLGGTPRWSGINGTRVEELAEGQRPAYDMFRFNGGYYAYNNNRWYSSPNDRGDFVMIDDDAVPRELQAVPRDHWRSYPQRWTMAPVAPQPATRTTASLQIRFGSSQRWSTVGGTRVEEIAGPDRPDHDVFRVDGGYYAYDNDTEQWYMSRSAGGVFYAVDEDEIPSELNAVPRDHWRNYPQRWADRGDRGGYDRRDRAPTSMQVDFAYNPRWMSIRGTRAQEIRGRMRPDYDIFRYAGVYYVYNDDQWYMSRLGRGRFMAVDGRSVPWELSRVPRDRWQDYPQAWMNQQRDSRDGNRRGGSRWGADGRYR